LEVRLAKKVALRDFNASRSPELRFAVERPRLTVFRFVAMPQVNYKANAIDL
jgi:hypothetical protein